MKEFDFLNITQFHKAGYLGQGIVVASREKESTQHGSKVAEILKMVCPQATILYGVNYRYNNEEINKVDVYTTSLDFGSDDNETSIEYAGDVFDKDCFLVGAVGNESGDSATNISANNYFQSIGACTLNSDKVKRAYYSSTTKNLDYMSFSHIKLNNGKYFDGTSCAAPLFAGMVVLLQCYFLQTTGKKLTNEQLLNLLNENCLPLEGGIEKVGKGLFILPDLEKLKQYKRITLQISNDVAEVNGEKIKLDVVPMIINNRTLIPLRFVAENLNCNVVWNGETRTIEIDNLRGN